MLTNVKIKGLPRMVSLDTSDDFVIDQTDATRVVSVEKFIEGAGLALKTDLSTFALKTDLAGFASTTDLLAPAGAGTIGILGGGTVQGALSGFGSQAENSGANLIAFKRKKIVQYMDTVQKFLEAQSVSIWEFSNVITNKPTADPQTWDWSPALQALADYCLSYVSQTAVNSGMFGAKEGYLTPGIFPMYSTVNVARYGVSNGSLQSVFRLWGAGRTASVLQPMTAGMTGIIASNCAVVFEDFGMRAGSTDQVAVQLGLQTVWAPVAHAIFSRWGTSGFVQGTLAYLLFDSTFTDCFWQNIAGHSGGTGSYGVRFAVYTGPENGGTAGDGSGDGSNQVIFVRPTIETSSDDSFMFSIEGKNGSYPTHSISFVGGHLETHNLKAKLFNMRNAKYISLRDTTLSQNGDTSLVSTMWRAGFIENCQNVLFDHVHITTTNRLATYSSADTVMIKILGTCQNVNFRDSHFLGPYQNANSTKHRLDYLIDYSEANLLKRSFDVTGCVCGDNQSREITDRLRIGSLSGIHDYRFDVDETTGSVSVWYSSNITDVPDGAAVWQVTPAGVIKTAQNLQIGALSPAAVTRGVEWLNNGDQATTVASVLSDNVGRVYIKSVGGAQEWVMGSVAFNPTTTAAHTLGTSAAYPSNIYSQNAVTVVSDINYKDMVKTISEEEEYDKLVAAVGSVPISAWKLKSAIAEKGVDKARWHVGVIAQQVRDAISDAGLDWTHYGLITYESHSQVVIKDDAGNYFPDLGEDNLSSIPVGKLGYIEPVEGADRVEVASDGTVTYVREIYMLRMEEFMILRMAYMESKLV